MDGELAYLEPSIELCLADNIKYGWGLEADFLKEMIYWHHKILPYGGKHQYAKTIEVVRKSDWIDFSKGKINYGMPKTHIKKVEAAIDYQGFHQILGRLGSDLTDGHIIKMLGKFAKLYKL